MTQVPANARIIDLPIGTTPTGVEPIESVQNGISVQLTQTQIALSNAPALSVRGNPTNASAPVQDVVGTANQVLRVNAAGTGWSWGQVNLASGNAITGSLLVVNGGTGFGTYTLGDILYSDATNSLAKLAGNITTTRKFLRQTGNGAVSAAPVWDTLLTADVPAPGSDTQVIFNDGGVLGSDAGFVYQKATDRASLASALRVGFAGFPSNDGCIEVGDANFRVDFNAGAPFVGFDSGDFFVYSRSANQFLFQIGSATQVGIGSNLFFPNTPDVVDIGTTSLRFGNLFLGGDASFADVKGLNWSGGSVYFRYHSTGVPGHDLATSAFNIVGGSNQHSQPALVLVNNDTGTPAGAGGSIYWQGPNSVGAQKNGALINAGLVVATSGAEQGLFDFHVLRNGADVVGLTLSAQVAALLSAVGWDLGTTGFPWGSVFLKSGAVINLANGDVTITHASDTLTFAGAATGYVFDSTIYGVALTLSGLLTGGATIITGNGVSTADVNIELGGSRSGSGNCYIDFHATSGSDYESRFIRASGANGAATLSNKGTGDFSFIQEGVGNIIFSTQSISRFRVESSAYAVDIPDASGIYKVNGTQVVKSRVTGYTAFTGTNTNRATAYDTATITLVQLAERVRALQVDLTAHGLIGA